MALSFNLFLGHKIDILSGTFGPLGHLEHRFRSGKYVQKFNFFNFQFFKHRFLDAKVSILAQFDHVLEEEVVLLSSVRTLLASNVFTVNRVDLQNNNLM